MTSVVLSLLPGKKTDSLASFSLDYGQGGGNMMRKADQKPRRIRDRPIEEHSTAAWANVEREKPNSKVPVPSTEDMELAREWVNHNRK